MPVKITYYAIVDDYSTRKLYEITEAEANQIVARIRRTALGNQ